MAKSPTTVTIYGRLSYPTFTYEAAVESNKSAPQPRKEEEVTPIFNVMVNETQFKKLLNHLKTEFIPMCEENYKMNTSAIQKGKTPPNTLDPRDAKKLLDALKAEDWEDQPPFLMIKPVSEASKDKDPEAKASLRIRGSKMQDVQLRAIVRDETELLDPSEDILSFPAILPIEQTTHTMYAGCVVAVTLTLYSYKASNIPGLGARANVCVFKTDAPAFSGVVDVDEDEIFAD